MPWIDSPRGRLHVDDGGAGPGSPGALLHRAAPGIPMRVVTGTRRWLMMDRPDEFLEGVT